MKCLGVDIGSSSIKIAEIDTSGRSSTLNQVWELKLSADPMRDQTVEVIEQLRGFTSQYMMATAKPNDVRWIIGVPQKSVASRLRRLPFTDRQKILKVLSFELEEEIPFDPSETVFDARIVEVFPNGVDVVVVACPHAPIERALQQAKDGGFEPSLVAAEGLALANILDNWWMPPVTNPNQAVIGDETIRAHDVREAYAIVQIGHTQTNVVVFREKHVVAIRSIPWGGHDVALNIESVFKVPYIEAMKVLQTKSFVLLNTTGVSRDQLAMHKAVSEAAAPLLREIRTTILDLRTSAGAEIQSLRLTGGASQIQNFGPWLTQSLEVSTNSLEYFDHLNASTKIQVRVAQSPEIENVAATAIGLAIEGLRKSINPAINLRRGMFAKSNDSVKVFLENWGPTLQLAVAIFFVFLVYSVVRDGATLTLAERSDEIISTAAKNHAGLKGAQASAGGINRYIQTELRSIKNRETLAQMDDYISALDFVIKMAEKFPVQIPPKEGRGFDIDHMALDNDELIIEGRVQGPDLLAAIERELRSLARKGTVTSKKPANLRPGAPGQPFGFAMKLDRK